MYDLERYRRQNDRRTRWSMGRLGDEPRAFDSAVRADAARWDILRLPASLDSGSLQNDAAETLLLFGYDQFTSDVTF